ncbi:response regulator transcription factor [Jatrophihabitans sp. DSM 45814]
MRLLLVEDDDRVAEALRDVLVRHGFQVSHATGVDRALSSLDDSIDVVLLDLGLPDGDGFDLCASIRNIRDVPIIITTARSDLRSRVHGLHIGADDYMIKPYPIAELLARIHAVSRRSRVSAQNAEATVMTVIARGVTIDLARRVVFRSRPGGDREEVPLTRKEFGILEALSTPPGLVVRRERLLSQVWESNWVGDQHTLDVHVAAIRSKCRDAGIIETVRGIGYRLGED